MTDCPENTVFLAALERETPAEREHFLLQACAGNAQLRGAVDELLAAHARADNPLDQVPVLVAGVRSRWESPPENGVGTLEESIANGVSTSEGPGAQIGAYRLRELIGEGGFGQVFVAEQQQPVRRKVALKVIKPGMDSREVIARRAAVRTAHGHDALRHGAAARRFV